MPANPEQIPDPPRGDALARRPAATPPAKLRAPFAFPTRSTPPAAKKLADSPAKKAPQNAVLRGLKDLQQLQKQTIAVLEAVQGSLDDIHDVLRSPEATRGLEKQKNAATLLAKGFPRDAIEQASGATSLLPANPDAHLLLALSLAADQQFDPALAATRKGLALVDRRNHPLAIEAGLLHTLASLGNAAEAVDRWSTIIDSLPLPVLLEQMACIAACFPNTPPDPPADPPQDPPAEASATLADPVQLLDSMLRVRLKLVPDAASGNRTPGGVKARRSARLIDTDPLEIPANSLLTALEAAESAALVRTRRAILRQLGYRLHAAANPADILKFLTECLVPLADRGLERTADALAQLASKRLLLLHADAPTLHRAMLKFQMAGATPATADLAQLLTRWRTAGKKVARARAALLAGGTLFAVGIAALACALLITLPINPIFFGPILVALGAMLGIVGFLTPTWDVPLPHNRPPLTPEEIRFLRPTTIGTSLRNAVKVS